MMEKYDITGMLYWTTTYWWDEGPYTRQTPHNPWEKALNMAGSNGNGDGILLYPPSREIPKTGEKLITGPVNSLRWEMLREGIEDREYFWLLNQQINKLQAKGETDSQTTEAIAEARAALANIDQLILNMKDYEMDPTKYYAARKQVAKAIEELSTDN